MDLWYLSGSTIWAKFFSNTIPGTPNFSAVSTACKFRASHQVLTKPAIIFSHPSFCCISQVCLCQRLDDFVGFQSLSHLPRSLPLLGWLSGCTIWADAAKDTSGTSTFSTDSTACELIALEKQLAEAAVAFRYSSCLHSGAGVLNHNKLLCS